jgi:hypothetical protein
MHGTNKGVLSQASGRFRLIFHTPPGSLPWLRGFGRAQGARIPSMAGHTSLSGHD